VRREVEEIFLGLGSTSWTVRVEDQAYSSTGSTSPRTIRRAARRTPSGWRTARCCARTLARAAARHAARGRPAAGARVIAPGASSAMSSPTPRTSTPSTRWRASWWTRGASLCSRHGRACWA
jgi:hypothetical protein